MKFINEYNVDDGSIDVDRVDDNLGNKIMYAVSGWDRGDLGIRFKNKLILNKVKYIDEMFDLVERLSKVEHRVNFASDAKRLIKAIKEGK